LLLERAFPLMTRKLHRVAQLRRVELTSKVESRPKARHSREGGNQSLIGLRYLGSIQTLWIHDLYSAL
jgi:hypothetical protein